MLILGLEKRRLEHHVFRSPPNAESSNAEKLNNVVPLTLYSKWAVAAALGRVGKLPERLSGAYIRRCGLLERWCFGISSHIDNTRLLQCCPFQLHNHTQSMRNTQKVKKVVCIIIHCVGSVLRMSVQGERGRARYDRRTTGFFTARPLPGGDTTNDIPVALARSSPEGPFRIDSDTFGGFGSDTVMEPKAV